MAPAETFHEVRTADGRALEVLTTGDLSGPVLVFHNGTPSAAILSPFLTDAAAANGLALLTFSRPGYAGSTPSPGRSVAHVAGDTAAVLDALGVDTFVTLGWSGGGPHAIACAALLPERCLAAATIAGVAPYGAEGLDWMGGMGAENVEEFSCALEGEGPLTTWLDANTPGLAGVKGEDIADSLGDLVSEVDRASATGEFAEFLAAMMRRSLSTGIAGWRDDDLAFAKDWGFDLAALTRPVAIWQGAQDRMVPFSHGEWLAAHIPGASVHLHPDEGHLSLGVARLPEIIAGLVALGAAA
jgi:pimeloyl-ACP methyl ester carboxylesterase